MNIKHTSTQKVNYSHQQNKTKYNSILYPIK